jgi:nucleoid-associated protein YgaU
LIGPGTLVDGEHPSGHDLPGWPGNPAPDLRGDDAGVQRVGGSHRGIEPARQFLGEEHVAELGDHVLRQSGNAFRAAAKRAEVDALGLIMRVA